MKAAKTKPLGKRDLVLELSRKSVLSKKDVERLLAAFTAIICDALKRGQAVQLIPFGTFALRTRTPRSARNPRTGEKIMIKESRVVVFRPGKILKKNVT